MSKAASSFVMGLFVLGLAIVMWRATHNQVAWLVFFAPGACMVARGWALALREY